MALTVHLVLTSGGLRSAVAAAAVASAGPGQRLVLLHANDFRPAWTHRRRHAKLQAEHFGVQLIDVDLPRRLPGSDSSADAEAAWPLAASQLLLTAVAHAVAWGAQRVVWPVHCADDAAATSRVHERLALLADLVHLEHPTAPAIQTPLLELSDRQLVQLGAQFKAPFALARCCTTPQAQPCRACPACLRRQDAFAAAGLTDPAFAPAAS